MGNEIDLRLNYLGTPGGEATPPGLTLTLTPMAGGSVNPVSALQAALDHCGDTAFDFIVCPYTDTAASLNALHTFLNDQAGRWAWSQQVYGHAFAAYRGTLAACTTFGTGRNNQHEIGARLQRFANASVACRGTTRGIDRARAAR